MKIKLTIGLALLLAYFPTAIAQRIFINEIMSKNRTVLADEDGDFSDWIELYNAEDFDVSLENFFLSDDREELTKWKFPPVEISAKGFLLIFASDKDRLNVSELHTNFKIASEGEVIFLSTPDGVIHDTIPPKRLDSDESFGYIREGLFISQTLTTPTPNGMNFFKDQLHFSEEGGFYEKPIFLKVKALLTDTVYCSLSGDIPDTSDVLVLDSILIDFSTNLPNRLTEIRTSAEDSKLSYHGWQAPSEQVEKARIVRCASFAGDQPLSDPFSASYFVDPDIFKKYDLPIISLITKDENFFDDSSGIYVPGDNFDDTKPEWTGNFFESGYEWERPIHIEFFEKDGERVIAQNAGVRIHGGKTRQAAQKTLKFYGRNEYGEKFFDYPLLPGKSLSTYRQFLLRTTMGAWGGQSIIKDAVSAQIVKDFDIEIQGYQPAVVFMNGEYWGIHTIRERPNERFIADTYDLLIDSVALVQNQHFETTSTGSFNDFKNLLDFIAQNDLADDSNYARVTSEIDIGSYIDYYIAETFFANFDWPGNNMKQWRYGKNGKWRYIFYDLDGGMRGIDFNSFEHVTLVDSSVSWPNPPRSTFLFIHLLKNQNFKNRFIEKYKTALETTFHPSNSLKILEEVKAKYTPEMPRHIERWNFPDSFDDWENDVSLGLKHFLTFRPCKVAEQIRDFFEMPDFYVNCLDTIQPVMSKQGDFYLAPNPTNGNAFLVNNSAEKIEGTIYVFSLDGKLIREIKDLNIPERTRIPLNLTELMNGSYFLKLDSKVQRKAIPFLIMK